MIGQTISHYKILSRLGAGGMGEVYLAEDTKLDRQVALKFLPESMWNDDEAKQRLIREAKAASKLDHPNIVTIYGIEESDSRLFISMAHVQGTTLDKYLATNVRSTDEMINLALQVTDGLQRAHEAGVIHRDLKPSNILVDERGRVRLLDFGIARMRGTTRLTHVGTTVGTLAYSPPELIQGNDAEPTSDIYSLGVVLYQMLTGHLPFESDHEAALLYSILQDEPKQMSDHGTTIPANLQVVVMRCLVKKPAGRYADCSELATALRGCRSVQISDAKTQSFSEKPSIAVLPFLNRSSNAEDEYFSDGLADELLNVLGKIKGLRVVARASSFQFKGSKEDLATIGQKLSVLTLLDGSVRKSGNRIRVTVQLVRATDSDQLWSETYDRTLDDIFAVQDDIALSVVKELRAALLGEEQDSNKSRALKDELAKAARGKTQNPEAHRLYLQARHLVERVNPEDTTVAITYFRQALTLDPNSALAWTELSKAYSREADNGWAPVEEGYRRAREAVERALAMEPDLAEAHARRAWIQMVHDWDWKGAEASCRRALELAPGNPDVLRGAGSLAGIRGNTGEEISLCEKALEQDPLSASAYHNLGMALGRAGQYSEAEAALNKALELSPQREVTRAFIALMMLKQGRNDEALAAAIKERSDLRQWALAMIYHARGDVEGSNKELHELIAMSADESSFQIAEVYAVRGEVDHAFAWLERAYSQRDGGLPESKVDPRLRSLHADPRWPAFMKKMGFED